MAKINGVVLEALREAIAPEDTDLRRVVYIKGQIPRADRVQDLDKRYRWDLFWLVRGFEILDDHMNRAEREAIKDAHIDTALRSLVPVL